MPSSKVTRRRGLASEDLDAWPQVDSIAFNGEGSEERRQIFNRRSDAVRMYAQNFSLKEIYEATTIEKQSLYRLVDRCLATDSDGRLAGFRGLLRYRHFSLRKDDVRKLNQRIARAGSLLALFARYPSILVSLRNYAVLGKREGLTKIEIDPAIRSIHFEFLRLCEKAGIQAPHYPFNSDSEGKHAIRRWVKKIRLENHLAYLRSNDPDGAKMATARAPDSDTYTGASRCYQRVECDGHRIDVNCTIEMPSPTGGGIVLAKISRLWLVLLIEVMSGATLGYSISFGVNYSAADVMKAVRNSLLPWRKRELTVTTIDYQDGDGFPSGLIEGLSFCRFDELCLDNAKSHLSRLFMGYLERTVAAVPVFSPGGTPNSHPYIEGFFNILEEAGIHQTIGTTGANTKDLRKTKDSKDLRYHLTYELLLDLIDLLLARINGNPAPNSSISRLEVLQRMVTRRTTIIRRIPESLRKELMAYDMYEDTSIGRNHRRPIVRFHGANYSNNVLSSAFLLVGRSVVVRADSEDLRTIFCVLDDGTSLGVLPAERRWRQTRHGLATRREAGRLLNSGHFHKVDDIPRAFRLHLEAEAKESTTAAAKLKRVQLEQEKHEPVLVAPAEPEFWDDINENKNSNVPGEETERAEQLAYAEASNLLKDIGTQYRR